MDDRRDDISAGELLAKLKANMEETEAGPKDKPASGRKTYHFRRSAKTAPVVTEESIRREMPEEGTGTETIPKAEVTELDLEALMKKYLPEEDYLRMTAGDPAEVPEEEDDLVRTLTSIDVSGAAEAASDDLTDEESDTVFEAPDSELFADLSAGGKVCDIPQEADASDTDEKADTRSAPLRPIGDDELTRAFVRDEEESAYVPIGSEELDTVVLQAPPASKRATDPEPGEKTDMTITKTDLTVDAVDLSATKTDFAAEEAAEPEAEGETAPAETAEPASFGETVVFSAHEAPEKGEESDGTLEAAADADRADDDGGEPSGETPAAGIKPLQETEKEPEEEPVFTIDETDANLMLAFGMDDELDQAIGKENADKLRTDMDELSYEEEKPAVKAEKPSEPIREYISPAETKGIMDSYKAQYGKNALRLFGMVAVAIVLFFYENLTALGGHLADALNPEYFPVVNVMVGLQILFFGFLLCFPGLVRGAKSLISKKLTPDSLLPILFAVSVLFAVCACFFQPGTTFVTFYFPTALCLLISLLCERLDLHREIMSFNIISSKRTKFALEKLDLDEAELETRAFDEILPKQPSIFRINKTAFIDGFFRRTKAYPALKQTMNAVIPSTLALLAVGLIVGFFRFGSWQDAAMLGYTVFSFAMPAAVFLTFGLPAFNAGKRAFAENSTFVGEAALDEYTTASATASISFDDREVFPTGGVKLRSIKVFGSGRIDTVIYNAASIYAQLGGPLSDVLNVATADLGRSQDTEILSIENDGVEAVVDDRHINLGKADYLRRHGYLPVSEGVDEELETQDGISILFLVCDDEVVAKLYVAYRIDPEFEVTLKSLYRSGICVGIKTVDPNINDEMLSTRIRLSKYPVRVLKYTDVNETRHGSDRTDSGIVSKKSVKALLRTFTLCDKVKHVTRTNLVINFITMAVGLGIALSTAIFGGLTGIASVFAALYQLVGLLLVYLFSRFMLL